MTIPCVIFLDIDGVLANAATKYRYGDPACVARLNRITDATGAVIVVSSTWRHDPEIASVLASWGVTGRVIGRTPHLHRRNESGLYVSVARGDEIQQWIAWNWFTGRFVILDDDDDMLHLSPRLVQTNSYEGLRDADVERAIAMLGQVQP